MPGRIDRRGFLSAAIGAGVFGGLATVGGAAHGAESPRRPNIVFVFGDQWRAQATGYSGDPNAKTPNLDALARESVNFTNAVSGCPVCSPYRASLMTGQYPLTHGVFVNDVHLSDDAVTIGDVLKDAGYDTAYIGKWHLDGHGRSSFIPRERRQGFDYWKVLECTHDYNNSAYYADEDIKLKWEGYDAAAQTRDAARYIREHGKQRPFALFLSWGPPHEPYETAPKECRRLYSAEDVVLRPNVPAEAAEKARKDLAGYYAHIVALDTCLGELRGVLKDTGLEEDTILIFTSDHGDMLGSQGYWKKQRPYDESVRVPFLLRYPRGLGVAGRETKAMLNAPDIMPTLLGLSGVAIPSSVQGFDFTGTLKGGPGPVTDCALLSCPQPFGQVTRADGGREYRGIRTARHTYVRNLDGPWLLFDNEADPYQMRNLRDLPEFAAIRKELDQTLSRKLRETGDEFLPGPAYIEKWGYHVDETGTVPYTN